MERIEKSSCLMKCSVRCWTRLEWRRSLQSILLFCVLLRFLVFNKYLLTVIMIIKKYFRNTQPWPNQLLPSLSLAHPLTASHFRLYKYFLYSSRAAMSKKKGKQKKPKQMWKQKSTEISTDIHTQTHTQREREREVSQIGSMGTWINTYLLFNGKMKFSLCFAYFFVFIVAAFLFPTYVCAMSEVLVVYKHKMSLLKTTYSHTHNRVR